MFHSEYFSPASRSSNIADSVFVKSRLASPHFYWSLYAELLSPIKVSSRDAIEGDIPQKRSRLVFGGCSFLLLNSCILLLLYLKLYVLWYSVSRASANSTSSVSSESRKPNLAKSFLFSTFASVSLSVLGGLAEN